MNVSSLYRGKGLAQPYQKHDFRIVALVIEASWVKEFVQGTRVHNKSSFPECFFGTVNTLGRNTFPFGWLHVALLPHFWLGMTNRESRNEGDGYRSGCERKVCLQ